MNRTPFVNHIMKHKEDTTEWFIVKNDNDGCKFLAIKSGTWKKGSIRESSRKIVSMSNDWTIKKADPAIKILFGVK